MPFVSLEIHFRQSIKIFLHLMILSEYEYDFTFLKSFANWTLSCSVKALKSVTCVKRRRPLGIFRPTWLNSSTNIWLFSGIFARLNKAPNKLKSDFYQHFSLLTPEIKAFRTHQSSSDFRNGHLKRCRFLWQEQCLYLIFYNI